MIPWETLGEATTPDGTRITLRRRGHEFLLLADGRSLMPSTMTGSEQALATVGCRHIRPTSVGSRVLIGGLGMGFTVRAALDVLPPDATIVVAELVPEVRTWNEQVLGHLAQHPLRDRRVEVEIGDALHVVRTATEGFDAILLDVDNGPAEFAARGNDALYSEAGLYSIRRALRPGGVLAVWSAWEDRRFVRRLDAVGLVTTLERVRGHGRRGARHLIYRAVARQAVAAW
jgi:spermidine synthase